MPLRHAFAMASLVDDTDCIYRLSEHLGHTLVSTTDCIAGEPTPAGNEARPRIGNRLTGMGVTTPSPDRGLTRRILRSSKAASPERRSHVVGVVFFVERIDSVRISALPFGEKHL
jgi:hypothetical protein